MVNFSQYLIEMPNILLENKTLKEHLNHFDELKQIPDEIEIEVEWLSNECAKSSCAETDSFKGTEHEGISMCDNGCVRAMPIMVGYEKEGKNYLKKNILDFCNWKDNNYRVSAYVKEPDGSKTAYYEANDYLNNNLFTAEELLKIYFSISK
jgi:hypothetical protein